MLQRLLRPGAMLTVAALVVGLAGCVPTVWLPDSSGFIYVKPVKAKDPKDPPTGQLVHYDLKKKAAKVIVENIGSGTMWPALSPDGKRIAIARLKGGQQEARTIQLVVYDFTGKLLHQSKELPWSPAPDKGSLILNFPAMLFWSPKDDKVVVGDASQAGIYNVKADTLKVIEKAVVVIHGGTPIRPDGKGFLLSAGEKDAHRLVLVDWTGAEQKVNLDALEKLLPKDSKDPMQGIAGMLFMSPLMLPSWWDGNIARVGFKRDKTTYGIDTDAKAVTATDAFAKVMAKKEPAKERPVPFDFAGDMSVVATQFAVEVPGEKMKKNYTKVVITDHKAGKDKEVEAKGPELWHYSASPDGQYVAVCMGELFAPDPRLLILVISSKGEVVARINPAE